MKIEYYYNKKKMKKKQKKVSWEYNGCMRDIKILKLYKMCVCMYASILYFCCTSMNPLKNIPLSLFLYFFGCHNYCYGYHWCCCCCDAMQCSACGVLWIHKFCMFQACVYACTKFCWAQLYSTLELLLLFFHAYAATAPFPLVFWINLIPFKCLCVSVYRNAKKEKYVCDGHHKKVEK